MGISFPSLHHEGSLNAYIMVLALSHWDTSIEHNMLFLTKQQESHLNFLSWATDVESVCLLYLSELCKMSMSLLIRPDQTTIKPTFDVGQEISTD